MSHPPGHSALPPIPSQFSRPPPIQSTSTGSRVPPCPNEGPGLWVGALPRQPASGVLSQICLHSPSPGMPMVSVRTCGFVCMLCEFDHTVSAFLSPPHSLQMLLCVCMETHTNTHFDPIFFSRSLPFCSLTLNLLDACQEATGGGCVPLCDASGGHKLTRGRI